MCHLGFDREYRSKWSNRNGVSNLVGRQRCAGDDQRRLGASLAGDAVVVTASEVWSAPLPLVLPFTMSGVTVSAITASGATINWTTNRGGDSQVSYGLSCLVRLVKYPEFVVGNIPRDHSRRAGCQHDLSLPGDVARHIRFTGVVR